MCPAMGRADVAGTGECEVTEETARERGRDGGREGGREEKSE